MNSFETGFFLQISIFSNYLITGFKSLVCNVSFWCVHWESEHWKHLTNELLLVQYSNDGMNTGQKLVPYSKGIPALDQLAI